MGRLFTGGGEWNDALAEGVVEPSASPGTFTTSNPRSGSRAYRAASSAVQTYVAFTGATSTTYFLRGYYRLDALPTSSSQSIASFASGATTLALVFVNTDGTLSLYQTVPGGVPTGLVGTSAAISAGSYFRLEISVSIAAGASDTMAARLDGTQFASATGLSITDTAPGRAYLINAGDLTEIGGYNVDDVAVNDSGGASQNSWPGPGNVVLLRPVTPDNARGANWVAGAGGTTNLFDALDNVPPVGVALASATNTSQIKNVTKDTTGNYDANLTTYTTAGINAGSTINVVQPMWVVGSNAGATISHAMLLVSNPQGNGGVESTVTPAAIAGTHPTNWSYQSPTAQTVYSPSVVLGTSPVIRVGKRTSSTSAAMADAMGAYVDYTPPSDPPASLYRMMAYLIPR